MRLAERLATTKRAVLLITAIGLPLVFFGRHEDEPFNITKLSLLLLGVSWGLAIHLIQIGLGHRTKGLRESCIPALALVVPLVLSWFFTPYQEWAWFGPFSRFTGLIPYACFALLGILLVDAFWGRPQPLVNGIAILGGVVGLYAVIQAVGLDPLWRPGVAAGFPPSTIGHNNFAGGFLGICLPFSLLLWARRKSPALGMTTTIAIGLGLVMTNSQGGWTAATAGTVVVLGAFAGRRWQIARTFAVGTVGALAVIIVIGVVVSAQSTQPVLGGTAKSRGLYWATATEMGADSPFVGRGPGAYAIEGVRYRHLDLVLLEPNMKADDPHNVALSFWANAGIPGALGFLLLVFWILRSGGRLLHDDMIGAAAFAGCIGYLLQAMVSIDEPSLRAGLWIAIASLAISGSLDPSAKALEQPFPKASPLLVPLVATAVALAAVGTVYSTGLMRAHRDTVGGKRSFMEGEVDEGREAYRRAIAFRFEPRYLDAYAFALGASALEAGRSGGSLIEEMTEVYEYLEDFPETHSLLGSAKIYFYWGLLEPSYLERAERALLRVEELDPENPQVEMGLSDVYLAAGDATRAAALLEPLADRLDGTLPSFWATLSVARSFKGETEAAEAALEQAIYRAPHDCSTLIARGLQTFIETGQRPDEAFLAIRLNCPGGDSRYLETLMSQIS